jgi:glyoxylase-like metal-dependent hydrolase (beta-lactamase superfamily II)
MAAKEKTDMSRAAESVTEYEVYAVRYGTTHGRIRAQNFVMEPKPNEPLAMELYFWVLIGGGETIVIDTGMHPDKAARQGHTMLITPAAALEALGVGVGDVRTVILTHLHYDHVGQVDAFPNARFLLQAEEMSYATGPWMEKPWFRRFYESDEIAKVVGHLYDGRLELHGHERRLTDGLSLHWVGGHSAGQEIVRVRTARGWMVLASDALHYYEEYERGIPFSVTLDVLGMMGAHDRIRELADSDDHVIPGHDPRVAEIYPAVSNEVAGKVFCLHVRPTPHT